VNDDPDACSTFSLTLQDVPTESAVVTNPFPMLVALTKRFRENIEAVLIVSSGVLIPLTTFVATEIVESVQVVEVVVSNSKDAIGQFVFDAVKAF